MREELVDLAIVGGGLAGGLIALAVYQHHPNMRLALIEAGPQLGGNHRWSWFESDLDEKGHDLLGQFRINQWDKGYDVRFPEHKRTLSTGYRSLDSNDFAAGLMRLIPDGAVHLGKPAIDLSSDSVTLEGGKKITARAVIDCRPFQPNEHLQGGWQIFMGRQTRLDQPHGIDRPIIMDAEVDQHAPAGNGAAYRFVYSLPLSAHEIFVEDTYYADKAQLDRSALSARIDHYMCDQNWQNGTIEGTETGLLPVITGGDFTAYQNSVRIPGVAIAGARGGFSHPLTSYTVPFAVENALAIAGQLDCSGEQLAAFCEAHAQQVWRRTWFYRFLGRMLFNAAEPDRRVRVFSQFYRQSQTLIERFYRGHSRIRDFFRILSGRPPVSVRRAIGSLNWRGPSLSQEKQE